MGRRGQARSGQVGEPRRRVLAAGRVSVPRGLEPDGAGPRVQAVRGGAAGGGSVREASVGRRASTSDRKCSLRAEARRLALPLAASDGKEVERAWSRCVRRYFEKAWRQELERWSAEERWAMLWDEYAGKPVPRGFYGFGFVDRKTGRFTASSGRAARYMGRNAAGYMARNVAGVGRHYVSARLLRETGVTMRALRACNWLHVRRKLIASGELGDDLIPGHWSDRMDGAGARGAGGCRPWPRSLASVDPRRGSLAPVAGGGGTPPAGGGADAWPGAGGHRTRTVWPCIVFPARIRLSPDQATTLYAPGLTRGTRKRKRWFL